MSLEYLKIKQIIKVCSRNYCNTLLSINNTIKLHVFYCVTLSVTQSCQLVRHVLETNIHLCIETNIQLLETNRRGIGVEGGEGREGEEGGEGEKKEKEMKEETEEKDEKYEKDE